MTVADTLDGAFQVIKARPEVVVSLAALVVVPFGLLVALADLGALGNGASSLLTNPETFEQDAESGSVDWGFLLTVLLTASLLTTLVCAALGRVVESWYLGRELAAVAAMRSVGLRWVGVVAVWLVAHVLQAVASVALVLPGIAVMTLTFVAVPACTIEGIGPFRAVSRSFRLVRRRFWSVLWVGTLTGLVALTLLLTLPLLPTSVAFVFGFGGDEYVAAIGTIAALLLTLPFVAGTAVMVYFDLRVRTEGLDLELAVLDHFGED